MSPAAPALLLIHGDERFLIDRDARAWLEAARSACASDLNVEVIEAPAKLDQVRRSLTEVAFLDDRRHLLVRDPPQLAERARRGADSAEALAEALTTRSPTTSVCLVAHSRVTPANPVLRSVVELGGRVVQHATPRGRELREWVERRVRDHGLALRRGAYDHLVLVAGSDLGRLETEVDKLVAYADGRPDLTDDEVRRLVGGAEQVAVWGVIERLLGTPASRGPAAIDALLADGVSAQYLIGTLASQFRELILAADLLRRRGGGSATLARELRLPPWRADRLMRWAGAAPAELVEGWLRSLQRLDAGIKAGVAVESDGLRAFALRAAGEVASARA